MTCLIYLFIYLLRIEINITLKNKRNISTVRWCRENSLVEISSSTFISNRRYDSNHECQCIWKPNHRCRKWHVMIFSSWLNIKDNVNVKSFQILAKQQWPEEIFLIVIWYFRWTIFIVLIAVGASSLMRRKLIIKKICVSTWVFSSFKQRKWRMFA